MALSKLKSHFETKHSEHKCKSVRIYLFPTFTSHSIQVYYYFSHMFRLIIIIALLRETLDTKEHLMLKYRRQLYLVSDKITFLKYQHLVIKQLLKLG
jgi:hypothetical protein